MGAFFESLLLQNASFSATETETKEGNDFAPTVNINQSEFAGCRIESNFLHKNNTIEIDGAVRLFNTN